MIRNLNIEELLDKIEEYSSDIEYCDHGILHQKNVQFWNFLQKQPISNSVIDRIKKENKEAILNAEKVYLNRRSTSNGYLRDVMEKEEHLVLGFVLTEKAVKDDSSNNPELNIIMDLFRIHKYNSDVKDDYIDQVFKPYIEILMWYLTENKSSTINDYFTTNEINELNEKLDEILHKVNLITVGQELLHDDIEENTEIMQDEFEELKEFAKSLKKKNWLEIFKGKLLDKVIGGIISIEAFKEIIYQITGEELKFLAK
ncbi:MAG: hypothetical protein JXB49_01370 [Bacteroidales bacterium]|nr:hypothetical protein [Bacteroidales bacterium]